MCTGWTWDYTEWHVTMPQLEALNKYWSDHPPIHLMIAAYLGIKSKTPTAEPPPSLPDIEE